jgi:hypothetical protein
MARHRIVYTLHAPFATPHKHAHIVQAEIVRPTGHTQRMTVSAVYVAMENGDEFYTYGETSEQSAAVHKYECEHAGCNFKTLRSAPDSVKDNNLDDLPACQP